ncbi:MAG TPA: hypothetical protein VGD53_25405 [Actinoallomurus sp.]
MAAHGRGSVNVVVQPPKDSLEAIATLVVSSRSVRTWNSDPAALIRRSERRRRRSSHSAINSSAKNPR